MQTASIDTLSGHDLRPGSSAQGPRSDQSPRQGFLLPSPFAQGGTHTHHILWVKPVLNQTTTEWIGMWHAGCTSRTRHSGHDG